MLVRDIGEFALIRELSNVLRTPASPRHGLLLSIGDDAAAWESSAGITTLSTDTLVEGTHFELDWSCNGLCSFICSSHFGIETRYAG